MNQRFGIVKQMMYMQRASCDLMIISILIALEQMAKAFERAAPFSGGGRKTFRQWVDINKKACEKIKISVDNGYSGIEKFLETSHQQGQQRMFNAGFFEQVCCHPVFCCTNKGDLLTARLRLGNAHSTEGHRSNLTADRSLPMLV